MKIFHSYVSLPEGICADEEIMKMYEDVSMN